MRSISWIFFTVVFLCTTLWLLFDKCHQTPPEPIPPEVFAKQDSITKLQQEASQLLRENYAELRSQKDSADHKIELLQDALARSEKSTRTLAGRVRQAQEDKDTVKITDNCNELVDTAIALANRSEAYRVANDSLRGVNNSLQTVAEKRIRQLEGFNSQMRNAFETAKIAYQQQGKELQKVQRKADKHYTIGIGGGGGITNEGKPGAMIGIFITRTLIRL